MNRIQARAGWLAAVACCFALAACAGGHPPPGPIDLIREAFDPDYDYRTPDRDRDLRAACSTRDLACSHEGRTICCSRGDGCCAGADGPYCCSPSARGEDRGWERDWDWDD